MPSSVTINDFTINGDAIASAGTLAAVTQVIGSGKPRLLTIEGRDNHGNRTRYAFFITPTTQVSARIEEEPGNPSVIPIFDNFSPNWEEILQESAPADDGAE